MKSNNALIVILGTVTLDAVGIGLVMPVLPGLLRDIVHSDSIASHYGVLLALYALMQFLCAPVLGALSDRFGRRPVLLISMTVMALDYAIMGLAASVWVLLVARAVSGITAATHSTANAFIADISTPDQRAKRFGLIGAAFGVGFVLGPIAGGLLAGIDSRAPFWAAAALAVVGRTTSMPARVQASRSMFSAPLDSRPTESGTVVLKASLDIMMEQVRGLEFDRLQHRQNLLRLGLRAVAVPRAQAELFGGGQPELLLANPISSDAQTPTAPPSVGVAIPRNIVPSTRKIRAKGGSRTKTTALAICIP